ncbi:hypothetical protein FB550_10966 [Neobacillus bataviensis]|uniref:Uncharacterized protein n=1 Tax=Neobacillus bataviensis TaxID=220685 RepID=A0A561D5C3_9BACI|nr:hypothetical protein FB550_10966 [Neobacillus bataviensis]
MFGYLIGILVKVLLLSFILKPFLDKVEKYSRKGAKSIWQHFKIWLSNSGALVCLKRTAYFFVQ